MSDITLKKLAELLNLSISTVSRALKDHEDISAETKKRVKELAAILDYEPNTYAINLRTNNSKEFGIIIPTIANDFYQSFISSLEEEARLNGYSLIILQSGDDPVTELENLKRCKQNRVSGIFVSITSRTTDINNFLKMGEHHIPVIFFDIVPDFEACNKICVDDAAAASMAAETLILKKKKNILAIFGKSQLSITQKRLKAFKETFVKYGSDAVVEVRNAGSTNEAFDCVMEHLATPGSADVVFCMSDEILIGVMRAIQTLGLKPPHDIGVLAISEGLIPTYYYPKVAYIETSGFKLAKLAFTRMLACVAGSSYVQELKIESAMVKGGSL
ncbi:MAG: LacI family DNA-binding transcriptional regulator [Mucilaginibacter sp.]